VGFFVIVLVEIRVDRTKARVESLHEIKLLFHRGVIGCSLSSKIVTQCEPIRKILKI